MKYKILIAVPYPHTEKLKQLLSDIAEVVEKPLKQNELEEEIKKDDYDALICWEFSQRITKDMILSAGKKLKIIATISVGYDHIDAKTAEERGIKVINAGAQELCASTYAVAEFVFLLLLTLVRKVNEPFYALKQNNTAWTKYSEGRGIIGKELFGKTLGIIGVGRIGSHIGRVGNGFQMNVIGYDPYVNPEKSFQNGVRLVDNLHSLLSESDFISINCCLTDETRLMIGNNEVEAMKKGAYIVNTARGEMVSENAILEGLQNGKIAGYAADVLTGEPPTEKTSLLLGAFRHGKLQNLVITPHIAWTTIEGVARRYPVIISNRIRAALLKETLQEWELLKE